MGILLGERLREVICPADASHLTMEFDDHLVITPSIRFYDKNVRYSESPLGKKGKPVEIGFEYNSLNNEHFLTIGEICAFNEKVEMER